MRSRRIILILLVIAQMAFIFCMSARDSTRSSQDSMGVTAWVCSIVVPDWEDMSAQDQEATIESLHAGIRTCAHFVEYAVLGLLMILAAMSMSIGGDGLDRKMCLVVWCIGALYAVSDEIHQIFVPGRAFQLTDIMIDTLGVGCGILMIWILNRMRLNNV